MKLLEHQGRELFARYGIAVPRAIVARTPAEAADALVSLGGAGVIKAQVLAGGRGLAGGVRIAHSASEATEASQVILGLTIGGYRVKSLLVEELLDIQQEAYLGLTLDRSTPAITCIASGQGGQEIEHIAAKTPQAVHTVALDFGSGPDFNVCDVMLVRALGPGLAAPAQNMARSLYKLFVENDCLLTEINPLALTRSGQVVAADAKVMIDNNALFRHEEFLARQKDQEFSTDEAEAHAAGLSFVALQGSIGCMVNGAGLAMATMDTIKLLGGQPANFLDVGGSSDPGKVLAALRILLRNPAIRVILVNIFGGITRCDDIAKGILIARSQLDLRVPLVIRLVGTNEEEGHALLEREGLASFRDMTEAVLQAIALQKGEAKPS